MDAVDPDADAIAAARALGNGVAFRQQDITTADLPSALRLHLLPGVVAPHAVRHREGLNGGPDRTIIPRIRPETMTMTEIRRESARLLPGRAVRTLVFWRYLLSYRAPLL
ncbi:hypothetical protein [Amycolatopsis sp. GM8]|uniref:hypothetical protein n=1 Tax=Amycolatopsis sp. GM8 TaxID=2896530 RepID=UPI001F387F8C|nr:hypothetical protein [Amycolatopsis sp. GM8]